MTDWGSHGAGTEAELITPLVIWGSGVRDCTVRNKISQVGSFFQFSFCFAFLKDHSYEVLMV